MRESTCTGLMPPICWPAKDPWGYSATDVDVWPSSQNPRPGALDHPAADIRDPFAPVMMNNPFVTSPRHQIISRSADQTQCLGAVASAEMLAEGHGDSPLTGELGRRQNLFHSGVGAGIWVSRKAYDITSPTYTLINEYPARLPFVHADLYRIASSLDADGIGLWDLCGPNAVVAVEWSDRLDDGEWPEESLCLAFHILDDLRRRITLIGCGLRSHDLIEQVVADFAVECANSLK